MSATEIMDLEDLTPRQLRKALGRLMRSRLPAHKRSEEDREEDDKREEKEREDLADLMAEKKNTNTPKVTKDDVPVSDDDEEDEDE